jgi:cytoplasmic iron level regulating protein YaaA (DUF328/UPF0246 family)
VAAAGYPVGAAIAPIMPVDRWREEYGDLLDGIATAVPAGTDLTVECITHRFTPGSKATLTEWYPRSRLEMDESRRTAKRGRFGAVKHVYPREASCASGSSPRSPSGCPAPGASTGPEPPPGGDVPFPTVLVLLPPSETKAPGGDGGPLDLATLTSPELTPVRTEIAETVVKLAGDVPASRAALGLSPRQDDEIGRNATLWTSPTRPALERYTGVLYEALDVRSMTRAQRARAGRRLAVGSALFGLVRGEDAIPAYRLSAGSPLPGLPTLRAMWKPALSPVLARLEDLVVDLRSGCYAALAPAPGAVALEVLSERPDGTRAVVSHANKAHKGRVARLLALSTAEPTDVVRLRALLRRAGLHVEHDGGSALTLVVRAP